MTVTTREYVWMALDAYDARARTNDPAAPAFADPAVEAEFPGWSVVAPAGAGVARNASLTVPNGLEANIYVNEARGEVVVAFRGTESGRYFDAVAEGRFGLVDDANLDRDVETLFGYYQDGGRTIEEFVEAGGGLDRYLEENFGLGQTFADTVAGTLTAFGDIPFLDPIEELGQDGEATLRSQAREAILAVLRAAEDNPGKTVTVTGHSLGGALAAYAAAALGVPAVVFDPAPYGARAFLEELRVFADDLIASDFPGLDTEAAGWIARPSAVATVADRVTTERIEGSFVPDLYLTASPLELPDGQGTETVIGPLGEGVAGATLHSPDLHALAIDSRERAGPDRPALETLTEPLPSLVAQMDDPVLGPDGSSDSFFRTLLVEEDVYLLFADVMTRIAEIDAAYAPDGGGVERGGEAARIQIAGALDSFGFLANSQAFDDLPAADAVLVAELGAGAGTAGMDVLIGDYRVPERFAPQAGADAIAPGAGAPDRIVGRLSDLDGDTLLDFGPGDEIVVTDAATVSVGVTGQGADRKLSLDRGGAPAEAVLGLRPDLATADFTVETRDGQAVVSLADEPARLADAEAIALLYEAALGRQAGTDGLNFWIDQLEEGFSLFTIAGRFIEGPEFRATVGEPETLTEEEYIEALFVATLGRPGRQEGVDFWVSELGRDDFGPENALIGFALSPENREKNPEFMTLAEADGIWDFG